MDSDMRYEIRVGGGGCRRSTLSGAASPRKSLTRIPLGTQDCCPSYIGSTRSRINTCPVSPVRIPYVWMKKAAR